MLNGFISIDWPYNPKHEAKAKFGDTVTISPITGFQSCQSALKKLLPGHWKQKKFEQTGNKYNSRKRVTQVSVKYLLNVGGLSIDILAHYFSTYWPTLLTSMSVYMSANSRLTNLLTFQTYTAIWFPLTYQPICWPWGTPDFKWWGR